VPQALSFGEFLKLRGITVPTLPELNSLRPLFDWSVADFSRLPLGRGS
jgi:hypothetical protein